MRLVAVVHGVVRVHTVVAVAVVPRVGVPRSGGGVRVVVRGVVVVPRGVVVRRRVVVSVVAWLVVRPIIVLLLERELVKRGLRGVLRR